MGRINSARLRTLTQPGAYCDGGGLYLRVRDGRAWAFRYTLAGKAHWLGLGSYPDVSLAEAREAAQAARKLIRQGLDPIEQKRAVRAAAAAQTGMTFREVADRYIRAHEASWRNAKHRQQWRNTLDTYAMPTLGDLPVRAVEIDHVMGVLESIWQDKPETASRLRGRIESILEYARAHGWRAGENPARWRGHLANLLPARGKLARVEHHAALPWRDMGAFMGELAKQEGIAALALRFAILTAARTGEAIGARWSEVDFDLRLWTVPATRMKAGQSHRVPLSDAAIELLRQVAPLGSDPGAFIFPGQRPGKPLSNMALLMLLRRMQRPDLTAHGFRSTFRQWCAEATGYAREIAEAALAHTLRDKVEAAYQRSDLMEKRRRLMADWAAFCARAKPAGEVVPLRAIG